MSTTIFLLFLLLRSNAQTNTDITGLTPENPLVIGVPSDSFSSKFVQIYSAENSSKKIYSGLSIQVFEEVRKLLNYTLFYKFVEFPGTYDDLVSSVGNKTIDAAVGDITLTESRWELVEFTVPYTQSSLALVVQVKRDQGWILFKPFSVGLWLATLAIFCYSLISLWFLEQRSNPEFGGSWYHQLGNALWFTFTSLFFAHREAIRSNHARVVVVVWLFVVFIVMQSFTANLSSMLTVTRLNPNVDLLRTKDEKIGCNPFMKRFVENEFGYKYENIRLMHHEEDYLNAFKTGVISAALLEIPYAELLVNEHCKDFTIIGSSYRFGGLSFAFGKGHTQVASHVSEAILELSENGMLKRLEESWISSSECSNAEVNQDSDSLSLRSFLGLYLFAAAVMALSILVFVARLLINYRTFEASDTYENGESYWRKTVRVLRYLKNAELGTGGRAEVSSRESQEAEEVHGLVTHQQYELDYII